MDEDNYQSLCNTENTLWAITQSLEDLGDFNKIINNVKWKELGITKRTFIGWWKLYKSEESQRKIEEQKMNKHIQNVQLVLNKLTSDERTLLGF
jgi:hypothetical protein